MESQLPPPATYDVLVADIHESSFADIGAALGCTRLSSGGLPAYPVRGCFYGPCRRIFLQLVVRAGQRPPINVLFMVDTGAPVSFLRRDTLRALGFVDATPECANVTVHGVSVAVGRSHGHFDSVDLLGQDFFTQLGGVAIIDYGELTVELRAPERLGGSTAVAVQTSTTRAAL
jgi:hypothetical protein